MHKIRGGNIVHPCIINRKGQIDCDYLAFWVLNVIMVIFQDLNLFLLISRYLTCIFCWFQLVCINFKRFSEFLDGMNPLKKSYLICSWYFFITLNRQVSPKLTCLLFVIVIKKQLIHLGPHFSPLHSQYLQSEREHHTKMSSACVLLKFKDSCFTHN